MAKRNRGSLAPDRRLIWAQIIHYTYNNPSRCLTSKKEYTFQSQLPHQLNFTTYSTFALQLFASTYSRIFYFWMCPTSVQSILVLLLVTNISLSTRKWLTTYRTQNTHFYITVEVLHRSQIALHNARAS